MTLVIAEAAKSSRDATGFFGYLQKLFCFFSGATQRWSILTKHVNLTVKSWSAVRWKSRLKSVTAARSQIKEIRNALTEARETVDDSVAKIDAQALAEEVASFRFLICSVVWWKFLRPLTKQTSFCRLVQCSSTLLKLTMPKPPSPDTWGSVNCQGPLQGHEHRARAQGEKDWDGSGNHQPSSTVTTDNLLGVAHISPWESP